MLERSCDGGGPDCEHASADRRCGTGRSDAGHRSWQARDRLRGIGCTIIQQKEAPQFLPKMERCNARTMEIYRRMGLIEKIRAAGLRSDIPMDVYVELALNEPPLLRLPYPSVNEARATIKATNDGTEPLEHYQLISQYTLEPLLKSIAEAKPLVDVRFGTTFGIFTPFSTLYNFTLIGIFLFVLYLSYASIVYLNDLGVANIGEYFRPARET